MGRKKQAENEEPTPEVQDAEGALAPETPAASGNASTEPAAVAEGAPSASEIEIQLAEQKEKYLRLAAEYDNYRKRSAKERLETGSRAQAEIVSRLVDALDDLARFADID